jgi:uncharacterized protein YbbC (DUF1343 family)
MKTHILLLTALLCCFSSCTLKRKTKVEAQNVTKKVIVGAERQDVYVPLLKGKRVALLVNQTAVVGEKQTHLLDTLIHLGVNVVKVFAPEHGFRGDADAGEKFDNTVDAKTGIPVVSLYGKNRKPSKEMLADVDVLIFDIQDVGARFYTFISTMHYAIEACANHGKEMFIFDRPNPCDYVQGPIMQDDCTSFVGVDPIPLLHGCTVGELAQMINEEGWCKEATKKCTLKVIKMLNWRHGEAYSLPIKPSPNLPNDQAIALYPSLCLFEATRVSIGRGTYFPFQVIGAPDKKFGTFSFTPQSLEGYAKHPIQQDKECFGVDLRKIKVNDGFSLNYFLKFYQLSGQKDAFFKSGRWFDQLMGNKQVRKDILAGKSQAEIEASWQKELDAYKVKRAKYLLYD